jgi:hypothetical protein
MTSLSPPHAYTDATLPPSEGREIISNLSKAAGLAHMISTMRPGASLSLSCCSPYSPAFYRH